ncbi:MAG: preprotein translocase subunit SecA [Gammaproteobacteria bacterium]
MITNVIRKIVGSRNERQVRRMRKTVESVNALEPEVQKLSDAEIRASTDKFRQRRAAGESLEQLLPEVFATVREAARRTLDMRHFDVQIVGGIALHEGRIAEMRTGEGKTLVATLPAYLNALDGYGVHIVTVNDYLARRDAEWMGHIYEFLGMRTGVVVPGMLPQEKQEAYAADIVYGTNNEYGFDYLRDNMAFMAAERAQGRLHYAIVDEVDSILIDEARTPLIISGPTDENSDLYVRVNRLIPHLKRQEVEDGPGDFNVDEKAKQVYLTEEGHQRVEELLEKEGILQTGQSLYDASNIVLMHHLMSALRAHALFTLNVDYIVKDGEIVIVDEFTGRTMHGRRWSEGLHQAMEAKEGVPIQNENQTLASITFQNFFRLYDKLSGMTGTADTEAPEFLQIYGLEVLVIPTHMDMIRSDLTDLVYLTKDEKFAAILEDIRDCRTRGQPALVGTASIETSEFLSGLLTKESIPHQVLNAKQHAREAEVIVQAGRPGTITIATNMAGRGTDIVLGGNLQAELEQLEGAEAAELDNHREEWRERNQAVLAAGGLHIIGTERHESRRIDNQLRGRSGRQGDVGSSRFYLSLKDDLMRIFASDRVSAIMQKLGMEEGEAIEHPWVTKAIENAQRKVEGRNFDVRKQLLEYDDVASDQRKEIYALRNELMGEDDVSDRISQIRGDVLTEVIDAHITPQSLDEQWDVPGLEESLKREFDMEMGISGWLAADESLHEEPLRQRILDEIDGAYEEKKQHAGEEVLRNFEKAVMLQVLDAAWKEHLAAMDYLRQGIHLRGYAQKNPKQEYKREAFEMFQSLTERIKYEVINLVSKVRVRAESDVEALEAQRRRAAPVSAFHPMAHALADGDEGDPAGDPVAAVVAEDIEKANRPFKRPGRKVGRNEPCPCGSGKKYKQCHGLVS